MDRYFIIFLRTLVTRLYAGIDRAYQLLLKPKSADEDNRRRERVLTFILFGMAALTTFSELQSIYLRLTLPYQAKEISLWFLLGVTLFFWGLYVACRKGHFKIVRYVFLATFFAIVIQSSFVWGVSLPMGILSYALLITMTGIILDTRSSVVMTGLIAASILIVGMREARLHILPQWKQFPVEYNDLIGYVTILSITTLISWLGNRELEKSLKRARTSEAELTHQRDHLEILVEQRTEELRAVERERVRELYRFAEFGKRSAGLFHDLLNPLTAVSLSMERLDTQGIVEHDTRKSIDTALSATRRMQDYMSLIRRQMKSEKIHEQFSVKYEFDEMLAILGHQALKNNVRLLCHMEPETITLFGNPLKFSQMICNLVANAIDSYQTMDKNRNSKDRIVRIMAKQEAGNLIITVRDRGIGISPELASRLFKPFVTTKVQGIGLGLVTVKDIVEKHFKGNVVMKSRSGTGTMFTVTIPLES